MPIRGSLDRCDDELIEGWVMLVDLPEKKLLLEAVLGDQIIGQFVADQFRADLQAAGLGDGACAFSFANARFCTEKRDPQPYHSPSGRASIFEAAGCRW